MKQDILLEGKGSKKGPGILGSQLKGICSSDQSAKKKKEWVMLGNCPAPRWAKSSSACNAAISSYKSQLNMPYWPDMTDCSTNIMVEKVTGGTQIAPCAIWLIRKSAFGFNLNELLVWLLSSTGISIYNISYFLTLEVSPITILNWLKSWSC